MTREGIVAAGNGCRWTSTDSHPTRRGRAANDNIVRESFIYDVVLDKYNRRRSAGRGDPDGSSSRGPYTSDLAADFTFEGPCFEATG
ncbi:MAG: hypothetical protein WKF45_07165 [Ilumatobacteraceae bacterium]